MPTCARRWYTRTSFIAVRLACAALSIDSERSGRPIGLGAEARGHPRAKAVRPNVPKGRIRSTLNIGTCSNGAGVSIPMPSRWMKSTSTSGNDPGNGGTHNQALHPTAARATVSGRG